MTTARAEWGFLPTGLLCIAKNQKKTKTKQANKRRDKWKVGVEAEWTQVYKHEGNTKGRVSTLSMEIQLVHPSQKLTRK